MTRIEAVHTEAAPEAIGPYSQAVRTEELLMSAGQIGLDPATGRLADGIEAQTHRVLQNLAAVLAADGITFESVIKTTIYLASMDDFEVVNRIYGEYVHRPFPARSTVQVARLPRDALVEIDVVARRGD